MRTLSLVSFVILTSLVAWADSAGLIKAEHRASIFTLTDMNGPKDGGGTGFQVQDRDGRQFVVTNGHVCDMGAGDGQLLAWRDDRAEPEVLTIQYYADWTDLCVLSASKDAPSLELANNEASDTEPLFTLGHPFLRALTVYEGYLVRAENVEVAYEEKTPEQCTGLGFEMKDEPTMFGVMSICMRSLWAYDTTIKTFPGNSGSPVLNADGKVVGVIFAGAGRTNEGSMLTLQDLELALAKTP